jgi:FtsP/CotA-like multicopper oxidase with cupredoxin domain
MQTVISIDMTNIHTHGLHVSPEGKSYNVMLGFKSGDTFTYEYDLAIQPGGVFNFYHPHSHGTVAEQKWGRASGRT